MARQEIKLLKDGGANEDDIINTRCRYQGTSQNYTAFSKAMDLPQQRARVTADGLGNIGVGKTKISVDQSGESGIIKSIDVEAFKEKHLKVEIPVPPKFSDFKKPAEYAKAKIEWEKQYKQLYEESNSISAIVYSKSNKKLSKQLGPMNDSDILKHVISDTGMDEIHATEVIESLQSYTGDYYTEIRNLDKNTQSVVKRRNEIEEFISKSPSYDGKIYRGIRMDEEKVSTYLSELKIGNNVDMKGISSWSSDEKIAVGFAGGADNKPIEVVFECEKKWSGNSIFVNLFQ